jgi:PleD family two-component response regulator
VAFIGRTHELEAVRSALARGRGEQRPSVVVVDGEKYSEDDLMPALDAGAEDIVMDDDMFEILCEPSDLAAMRAALVEAGIEIAESQVMQRPKTLVPLDEEGATKLMKLIDETGSATTEEVVDELSQLRNRNAGGSPPALPPPADRSPRSATRRSGNRRPSSNGGSVS